MTGIAAGVFSALALELSLTLFASGRGWRAANRDADAVLRSQLRAQRRLQRASKRFLRVVGGLGMLQFRFEGTDQLQQGGPHLIVSNHPTLIDFVILCSLMPQTDCIVKAKWAKNPLLRQLIRAAGFVRSDTGRTIVEKCAESLARGRSLIIFPEGTRSPSGGLGPFQRGAAHIALHVDCDILPVLITCEPPVMWKHWKWYDLPERPIHVTVRVRETIPSKPVGESGLNSPIAARRLTAELRETFLKGLNIGDA